MSEQSNETTFDIQPLLDEAIDRARKLVLDVEDEVVRARLMGMGWRPPAEDAHPATTPAPVAVEAYRYAQSMAVTERARGHQDEERAWLDLLHLLDRAAENARPEPVVAPLPSEAVLDEVRYHIRTAVAYGLLRGKHGEKADPQWVEGEIAGMVERLRRLVPEDDEDTVRVPRKWLEADL